MKRSVIGNLVVFVVMLGIDFPFVLVDCNVHLLPNLAFDFGYLVDVTSSIFLRMVHNSLFLNTYNEAVYMQLLLENNANSKVIAIW